MKKLTLKVAALLAGTIIMTLMACEDDPSSEKCTDCGGGTDTLELEDVDHIFTFELTLPQDTNVTYRNVAVEFNMDSLLEQLGYASEEELTAALGTVEGAPAEDAAQIDNEVDVFTKNGSTKFDYLGAYSAAGIGYWFDKNGDVTSWGATEGEPTQAMLYLEWNSETLGMVVGQYPNRIFEGEEYKLYLIMSNKDEYRVAFIINITVGPQYVEPDYVDPETAPTGDPQTTEKTLTATHAYASDWSSSSIIDVKEDLRQAFKMTTYQIGQGIEAGDMVFSGLNADGTVYKDGDGNIASTAAAPGHWYDANGNVTVWGDSVNVPFIYSELRHTNESLEFGVGHHPDNAKSGDQVTIKQIAELNGGKVTFTVNVTIE